MLTMRNRHAGSTLRGFLLMLVVAISACGPLRRGSGEPALLVFENGSLEQATVYIAVPGVELRRVGTVMAGRTDTLEVPADLATRGGSLNIVARLLARSEVPQTGPVSLSPGEHYRLRLTHDARIISFLPGG
jgi:hypothetical protein